MNTKVKKYSIIMSIIALLLVSILAIQVNAADPTTGSITIIAHEQQNGDTTTNPPLKGVEYTIYKVDETVENTTQAEEYITTNSIIGSAKTTGEDGTVIFDNLELGRYYVKVTSVLEGVVATENFIVDLPRTNATGTGFDYDITVHPKVKTVYSNLEFTKVDMDNNPIKGASFKIQGKSNDNWVDLPIGQEAMIYTTNDNGVIELSNIPADNNISEYRFIEVSAPDKYIINNDFLSYFTWKINSDGTISQVEYYENDYFNMELDNGAAKFKYVNQEPNLKKEVKNDQGVYVDSAGKNINDELEYKITISLPRVELDTFILEDVLPEGINYVEDSLSMVMYYGEEETMNISGFSSDIFETDTKKMRIVFDSRLFYDYDAYEVVVTYKATIDKDNVVLGGNGNINTATLEYTNKINENGDEEGTTTVSDTAEVHTGAVLLEKVEKGNVETKLAGAKFKIATTKENAEDEIFVQDETGADIEVTTGDNGQAIIEGLKYADDGTDTSYWLVETQAPSYQEDGVTKYYNLLKAPLEVKVGKITHQSAVQIENGKGFELPETGSIGLIIFTLVGVAVMTGAVVLNKKQKVQE